jgi:hypothetical protein
LKWRTLLHIEDKLSFTNTFSYQWNKNFNLALKTRFVPSQMEFSDRNLFLSYWLNDEVSLHYRNQTVPRYVSTEHQFTAFVHKGDWKIVSGLVFCPKVSNPFVLQAFKFRLSDQITFKGRATSLGRIDLAAQVKLNENSTLGLSQQFQAKEIASGKFNSGFGLQLRFHY